VPRRLSATFSRVGNVAVDVVVVTYRSAGYVADCLQAAAQALRDVPGARVIVVDNASGDDIEAVVETVGERCVLVRRHSNDGFAHGCHAGAEISSAERLLFVNPDAVVEADTVAALLAEAAAFPQAGIIGGRSVASDGSADPQSWMGRPTLWSALCFAIGLSSALPGSRLFDPEAARAWDGRSREVPVVSGGLMLVERRVWDQLGGFDRQFFLYGEDVDLCLRARRADYRPRVCGGARYRHSIGASSSGSNRLPLVMRGRVTTYRKNLPSPAAALSIWLLVAGTGVRAALAGLRPAGGRRAHPPRHWREAWDRRAEWRRGWTS
jgi:N-acetylglucosaminyl-diphospho-decaprenol L-rhamnosyltransferase